MARNRQEQLNENGGRKHKYYSSGHAANYAELDGQRVIELIEAIANAGGAVRLGKTRDGGAYAIGIYGDGDQPYTDYLKPSESVVDYLTELVDALHPKVVKPADTK